MVSIYHSGIEISSHPEDLGQSLTRLGYESDRFAKIWFGVAMKSDEIGGQNELSEMRTREV
jgi:hypothetical protein